MRNWTVVEEDAAFEHVLAGGSLYVEARAGTGKSYFLRRCSGAIRSQGKGVQLLSATRAAVSYTNLTPS